MDFCRNIPVSGTPEQQLYSPSASNPAAGLDDLFSANHAEEGDMNLEWLSIFVEDCLSSSGNCIPHPAPLLSQNADKNKTKESAALEEDNITITNKKPILPSTKSERTNGLKSSSYSSSFTILHKLNIPGKARSKRSRRNNTTTHLATWLQMSLTNDPPLLKQAYWLADSELILPKKEEEKAQVVLELEDNNETGSSLEGGNGNGNGGGQARRCSHCLSQRTPQWRAGPLGPKTLCNACGVRYKSGRLLPEYRPAKSPTFVSYKHSNSHKKVLEMRSTSTTMSLFSSHSNSSSY